MNESHNQSEQPTGPQENSTAEPTIDSIDSVDQLQQLVRESDSLLVVGNRTKPTLSSVDTKTRLISTRSLAGILQYEPSEFTFTALAGTTLAEIDATLAAKHQYLPFDPMLVGQGATIGGTLAAGMSGPGRHRFGGIRDFILGAQFVAGDGQLIHSGGKVVKNAAGFDIPKLLVGSCGRLGAITALTFKVFPRPVELHTYHIACADHALASMTIATIARGRWELDAIDYQTQSRSVWIRIGGEASVCDSIAADIGHVIGQTVGDNKVVPIDADQATANWQNLNALRFWQTSRNGIVKIPTTLGSMQRLAEVCDDHADQMRLHVSVAGSIGWLAIKEDQSNGKAFASYEHIDSVLQKLDITGLLLRDPKDESESCVLGSRRSDSIGSAVKDAMDPPGCFPNFPG